MITLGRFFLVGILISSLGRANGISSVDCLGGEGPTPATDLTYQLAPGISLLPTGEGIRDFVVQPKRNQVTYRNDDEEIRELDMTSYGVRALGKAGTPFSTVLDLDERYLTLKDRASILDTKPKVPTWAHYPTSFDLEHLYWERISGHDVLYSLETVFVTPDQQQIKLYSFVNGQSRPYECNLPSKKGEIFHIGQGHEFPYIFLYKVRKDGDGSWVTSYNVKISGMFGNNQCRLWKVKPYSKKIAGNVVAIHKFPALETGGQEMFVVQTDHPTKNFLWDDGPECRYYDLGGRKPIILNHRQPIIATAEPGEGLTLIYPRKKVNGEPVTVRPLDGVSKDPVAKSDLWLSDDGTKLFAAQPVYAGSDRGKFLLAIDLKKVKAFRGDDPAAPRR